VCQVEEDLGLDKSVVALQHHNPLWIALGQRELVTVRGLMGELLVDVRHIGSTAVPGLDAKPILDIAGAMAAGAAVDEVVWRLTASGEYSFEGDMGADGGLLFVRGDDTVRTAHVHLVAAGSLEWELYLRFHEILVSDRRARAFYQMEKRRLAHRFSGNRKGYTEAKGLVVRELLTAGTGSSPTH
jgi:GrpB-like predicted nucleotidyltransferase (UPF0157 family)